MCTRIMDYKVISHINFRKHSVNCKLIIILAKRSCDIIQVIANLAPALSLPGGVYNFGSSNTENMVHTAQQFAQELDIAVQIEAADWTRNLVMDGKKLEKAGIRFDTTQQGIRHCLRDYGLASR